MGIYLNPGNANFKETLKAEIYVDKSMMIKEINRFIDVGNKYICVSRPRRFGKTIAGNMLSAYYSKGCDSSELFAPLKISSAEGYEERLNKCNVIKIDMNHEYQNTRKKDKMILYLEEDVKEEIKKEFPNVVIRDRDSLSQSMLKVHEATGETFIILIDEYDVLVREQASQDLFDAYLSFLNGLFKSDMLRPAIDLAYLTGILPVVRDKIQSKLNNFREYTILDAAELAEFIGFTSDEVRMLCGRYDISYEECQRWYNGYTQHGLEIYNPEAVIQCVSRRAFGSYWGQTSSYEVISDRIRMNFENTRDDVVRMIAGESVIVNTTQYLNTMTSFRTKDDLFTYLIHVGYLAYDREDKTCRIPNGEIRQEWFNAITIEENYKETDRIIKESRELLNKTIAGNEDAVAKALDTSHIHVTSNRSYNNEDALQSAIYLAYIYALNEYTVVKEMTAGRGFSDVTFIPFIPDRPAMIIELKRNSSADSAIDQIREKQYYDSLSAYCGDLLFVGIDYDEKKKTHACRIDRFVKRV